MVCRECGRIHYTPSRICSTCEQAQWKRDRQAVADDWFGGDTDWADAVLSAMPYSVITGWASVEAVLTAVHNRPK